jgi:Domain of unknown function (DUF4270)
VKHKHLVLSFGFIFLSTLIFFFSCKKINEATSLGSDLIPEVDNVNTFDTFLYVEAYNDTFTVNTDSTFYGSSYTHYLGHIESDPFFGKTDAKLFLELKPAAYKHTFINRPDSLHIDSVVLVLDYVDTYGDSTVSQTVNVYEVPQSSDFGDTTYTVRTSSYSKSTLLGSRTFSPQILNDSVKAYQDTTINQLRIRLDNTFGTRLLQYDTTNAVGATPAYVSDSAFRKAFKGFALESVSGNALLGFNLGGANTKLAIYYKDDNNDAPIANWDTAVAYFSFAGNTLSNSASYVRRDYTGTPLAASIGGTTPDDIVYIQNTPGSFARIKIPGLAGLGNRIVHRAELMMEEIYDVSDSMFPARSLYLDAYDATVSNYKIIPFDLSYDASGNLSVASFGINPVNTSDPLGRPVKSWRFNISRYVQRVVNGTQTSYDLRLSAPFSPYDPFKLTEPTQPPVLINTAVGPGRARLHGGDITGANPRRMRLRIVYSKI